MKRANRTGIATNSGPSPTLGVALSVGLHLGLLVWLIFWFQPAVTSQILLGGDGGKSEAPGGEALAVEVVSAAAILGFARPQSVSVAGDQNSRLNNQRLQQVPREAETSELLPRANDRQLDPQATKTDRPVAPQQERIFTGREERGRQATGAIQAGRTYGSAMPRMLGGIGIGFGSGTAGGGGLADGSEYGRRIQLILSRNYIPPAIETSEVQFVILQLRIARDGRILTVRDGRLPPAAFKQSSPLGLLNNAAERAVLASNPLPPFPVGFLGNATDAVVEVWFRYPR